MNRMGRGLQPAVESICKQIGDEAGTTENFMREVRLFLESLPDDLGRGSLNGMKAQLAQKCADYLRE